METLRDHEQEEGFRFWQMQKEWSDQFKDPDDIFFEVNKRKREIKEKMSELQSSLNRLRPKKKIRTSCKVKRSKMRR